VNPDTGGVEVYDSIMERVQCLDKSSQKKREAATTSISSDTESSQQILSSYLYSIKEEARLLNRDWEEYFGNDTPFEPYNVLPLEDDRRIYINEVAIKTFDSLDDKGIELKEKKILLRRILRDQDRTMCTEFIIWGDSGCGERSSSERFELKTIVRIPAQVCINAVSFNGDKVYAVLDGDPYGDDTGYAKCVFLFSLSHPNTVNDHHYVKPECSFLAVNKVASIHPYGGNHVLVGTDVSTIEIWDCSDKSAPNRIKILHATNPFPTNRVGGRRMHGLNSIEGLKIDKGRSPNFFLSSQVNGKEGVITLWQNLSLIGGLEELDFQMMVKIKYECIIGLMCKRYSFMVVTFDKFGCLYLDVYHLLGSKYVLNKFDDVNLPKGVEMTSLHPRGEQQIQFANRINTRHRIGIINFNDRLEIQYGRLPKSFNVDMNDRFLVIEVHDGLVGSNGESKSDGPGLIIIDLDEHAS